MSGLELRSRLNTKLVSRSEQPKRTLQLVCIVGLSVSVLDGALILLYLLVLHRCCDCFLRACYVAFVFILLEFRSCGSLSFVGGAFLDIVLKKKKYYKLTWHQNFNFFQLVSSKIRPHSTVGLSDHELHTQVVILSHSKCVHLTTNTHTITSHLYSLYHLNATCPTWFSIHRQ